jgi:hypothetical protein
MTQFLVVGEGGWLTALQPTKNQAMHPSLSTHLLGAQRQGGGRGGGRRRRQAASAPRHGGNLDTGGNSNGGGQQQSTINNQLKVAAATATETAMTAMTTNENEGCSTATEMGVALQRRDGGSALVAAGWQLGGSTASVVAAARWAEQ